MWCWREDAYANGRPNLFPMPLPWLAWEWPWVAPPLYHSSELTFTRGGVRVKRGSCPATGAGGQLPHGCVIHRMRKLSRRDVSQHHPRPLSGKGAPFQAPPQCQLMPRGGSVRGGLFSSGALCPLTVGFLALCALCAVPRRGTHSRPPGGLLTGGATASTLLQGWQPPPAHSSPISSVPATGPAMPAIQHSMAVLTTAEPLTSNLELTPPPCSPPKHHRITMRVESKAVFLSLQGSPGPLNPRPTLPHRPPRWLTPPPTICR